MATTPITLNIDSTLLTTAANALALKGGWQAQVLDINPASPTYNTMIANPVTKNAFAKQQLINYVYDAVADYQAMTAIQAVVPPASNLIS